MRNFTKIVLSLAMAFGIVGGAKANRFLVYNNGTAGSVDYAKQAICNFNATMVTDQQYIIKAKIKVENADGESQIGFWLVDEPNNKTSYQAAITPTSEFVEYTWYFTPLDPSTSGNNNLNPTRMIFNTGKFGGKVYIDDVTCKPNGGSTEFVDNGNFNLPDVSNWKNNYLGPLYTIDSDAPNADFVLVYNNGTAGSVDYAKQAICNFNATMVTDQQYIIKAKIKVENADGESQIGFWLVDEPNNKTSYQAAITPTSEFVEYTWYFTPLDPSTSGNNNLNPTRMIFNTGKFGGKVYIDDVTCKPNGGSTEFVENGDFNLIDISNWSTNYMGPTYTRWDYEVSAIVGADGFATYSAVKPINVDGIVTAYGAKYDGSKIVLTPVTEIPANTGVIIEAAADTYTVPAINSAASIASVNDLSVSDGSIAGNGSTIYALGKKGGVVGFVKVKSGVTIPAGKAYLTIAAAGREFIGFGEDVTGVEVVKQESKADNEYFNLAGQRVAQPTKGLYIVNGKKVIIK